MIAKRKRYNVWDLLSDVGGFNDGLILVGYFLTSAYTAASFKTKFLASIYYDVNSDRNNKGSRPSINNGVPFDPTAASFHMALSSAKKLKQSFLSNLLRCLCQGRRERKMNTRLMGNLRTQLDIRSFLKMYLDVRLLSKRILSKNQRKLFSYQRDRLPIVEDTDSFESDLDVDEDVRKPREVQEFIKMATQY